MDVIPGDKLDFGILEPGQRQTRSLWLVPNEAAAAKKPTVRLRRRRPPRRQLRVSFEPQTVAVGQKQEVKVTLVAGSAVGPQKARLKLTSDSPDIELAVSQLAAIYGAETGWIKFDVERLDYLGLLPGDSTPELRLRVAASQGAIGDTVSLAWEFGKLPPGMSVMPAVKQVTISQAGQEVILPLILRGAVGGQYDGTVKLTAKSRVLPAELPARIEVQQRLVEVVDPPRPWKIRASRFGKQCVVGLPLVVRANQAAAGVRFRLEPAAPLEEGIQIQAAPDRLKLAAGENTVTLTASIRLSHSFRTQSHAGELRLVTDDPGVATIPGTIAWEIVVPGWVELWPEVLILLVIALVLQRRFGLRRVLCRTRAIGGLDVTELPKGVSVSLQGTEHVEGSRLMIGMLRKYRIYIGRRPPRR